MLTIRSRQLDIFQADADLRLGMYLIAKMRSAWPGLCNKIEAEKLLSLCVDAVVDGRRIGLQTDQAIARMLNLRFVLGHDFPAGSEWAEAILTNQQLTEAQRLDYVIAQLLGRIGTDDVAS